MRITILRLRVDFNEVDGVLQLVPLQLVRAGQSGEIVDIQGEPKLVAQLAERGLRKGLRLEVLRDGDPAVCRIDNTRLSLRADGRIVVLIAVQSA